VLHRLDEVRHRERRLDRQAARSAELVDGAGRYLPHSARTRDGVAAPRSSSMSALTDTTLSTR